MIVPTRLATVDDTIMQTRKTAIDAPVATTSKRMVAALSEEDLQRPEMRMVFACARARDTRWGPKAVVLCR